MAINEADRIAVRVDDISGGPSRPSMSPSIALPSGRIAHATVAQLRAILGIPALPQNQIAQGVSALAITDGTNVAASVAGNAQFIRVGNVVFVSGSCTIDPTAGAPTSTDINIALPIASTLAASTDLSGSIIGNVGGTVVDSGTIVGDTGTDDALAVWEADHTDVQTYTYQFSYTII